MSPIQAKTTTSHHRPSKVPPSPSPSPSPAQPHPSRACSWLATTSAATLIEGRCSCALSRYFTTVGPAMFRAWAPSARPSVRGTCLCRGQWTGGLRWGPEIQRAGDGSSMRGQGGAAAQRGSAAKRSMTRPGWKQGAHAGQEASTGMACSRTTHSTHRTEPYGLHSTTRELLSLPTPHCIVLALCSGPLPCTAQLQPT